MKEYKIRKGGQEKALAEAAILNRLNHDNVIKQIEIFGDEIYVFGDEIYVFGVEIYVFGVEIYVFGIGIYVFGIGI